jgi:hypothetical protein
MPGRSECCSYGTSFEAKRWLSLDPCGFVCMSCSFGIHIYATTIIALFLIRGSLFSEILFGAIYLPLMTLAVLSLVKAWRTDPGSVPMGARPLTTVKKATGTPSKQRAIRRCPKCNDNFKPARAHHDSVTGRCIVKFDHYCPWVGNAVGALNHKFFVLFIGYSLCTCIMSICFILLRFVRCGYVRNDESSDEAAALASYHKEEDWTEPDNKKEDNTRMLQTYVYPECNTLFSNYFVFALFIIAVAFLVFTCCMLFEQIEAIESNQSKIARMKMKVGQGGTELERVSHDFNEMFGGDTPYATWHWYLPLTVQFPQSMDKIVLGYEWDPTFGDEPFAEDDMVAAIKGENKLDVDEEAPAETFGLDEDSDSLTESSPSNSLHSVGTKKRAKSKKPEDNPRFVDRTKDRLT